MPEFIDELTTIGRRLQQIQQTSAQQMLWEDPAQACQPFWDVLIFDRRGPQGEVAPSDDVPRPLVVFSAKPYVERRASRSRAR